MIRDARSVNVGDLVNIDGEMRKVVDLKDGPIENTGRRRRALIFDGRRPGDDAEERWFEPNEVLQVADSW